MPFAIIDFWALSTLLGRSRKMARRKKSKSLYHGRRFPVAVTSCVVRWYFRFQLSFCDMEELLFERKR